NVPVMATSARADPSTVIDSAHTTAKHAEKRRAANVPINCSMKTAPPCDQCRAAAVRSEVRGEHIVGPLAPALIDFTCGAEDTLAVVIEAREQRGLARGSLHRDADQGALIEEKRDLDGAIAAPK